MFFIFDCNEVVFGSRKGYKTHKGAQTQCGKQGNPIYTYSIRWVEQPTSEARMAFEGMFGNPMQRPANLSIR